MRLIIHIIFVMLPLASFAQTAVNGIVTDKKGEAIIGANIFLEGTYDGTTSEADGSFTFKTTEIGTQKLSITFLGFEAKVLEMDVEAMQNLQIKLRESVTTMDAVEVVGSTFKAGDNSKATVLKPLDIVTTAGALGDNIAALQTMPGTQSNPDDGRLFVRGGDASESKIFIDGMMVFSPYTRTIGGTPARGRFSPFLFNGLSFSTGGYSSTYGQALSGVLDMNTKDEANQTESNFSFMTVGVGAAHTQKWGKQSLSLSTSYIDLTPYMQIVPNRIDMDKPYRGFSGEAVYRYKTKKGLWKSYFAADNGGLAFSSNNLDTGLEENYDINNLNLYTNHTYSAIINDKTSFFAGFSFGQNNDEMSIDSFQLDAGVKGAHAKVSFKTVFTDRFILNYGTDVLFQMDELEQRVASGNGYTTNWERNIAAQFIEADYFFSKDLAMKVGLRGEYHNQLNAYSLSPRLTLAQKLAKNSQVSIGFGQFAQEANAMFSFEENNLQQEQATHYLANYNFKNKKHILRLEAYYKDYQNLTKRNAEGLNNAGEGFAYGFDGFWRANQWVDNLDFWITYSWLKHERLYRDYPDWATPTFSTEHNLSVVTKRWFPKLKSQLGLTYKMASGRPYEDPNTIGFQNEQSPFYHSVNMSWAYLLTQQKILFISVANVFNFKNNFGKRFGNVPDTNNIFPSENIVPNADQFFFVGFFWTISPDKTKNQLDTL